MERHLGYLTYYSLLFGLIADIEGNVIPKLDLDGKSLKLNYGLVNQVAGQIKAAYEVEELYSAWQNRSKLHYTPYGNKYPVAINTFYSDESHVLSTDQHGTYCQKVPAGYVDVLLYGTKEHVLQNYEYGDRIGASRLLSFIAANFAKFSLVAKKMTDDDDSSKPYITLATQFGSNHIYLVYEENRSNNLANGIPRAITIERTELKQSVTFEFTRCQTLSNSLQLSTSSVASGNQYSNYEINSVNYDLFAFPRAAGCSKVLKLEHATKDPLESVDHGTKRFSFLSRAPAPMKIDISVFHEPMLSTLRINKRFRNSSTELIINYENNRKFHIRDRRYGQSKPSAQFTRYRACITDKIKHFNDAGASWSSRFSTDQMLFGTESFAHLGLALVRGIEANVYEAHAADLPVWLQQPLLYEQPKQVQSVKGNVSALSDDVELKWRDEVEQLKRHGLSMINVFYFAKTNELKDERKLLLVELFVRDEKTGQIIKRSTFPIYEFSWDLASTNSEGLRYEDSFSLQDHCLAQVEDGRSAAISVLFEGQVAEDKLNWLQDRAKRNTALLRVAQDHLYLQPVSMVNDIKSRLVVGKEVANANRPEPDRMVSIAVSMIAAARTKSAISTRFICMADSLDFDMFDSRQINNFQVCHYDAAHMQLDTLFAYSVRESRCLILRSMYADESDRYKLIERVCKFGQESGNFEIYQSSHHAGDDYNFPFDRMAKWLEWRADVRLVDPRAPDDLEGSGIKLRMKSFDVVPFSMPSEKVEEQSDVASKFPSFGLIGTDKQNKVYNLHPNQDADDYNPEVMKFEDCQTACLVDLECQSFSVCVLEGKMRCVLSTVSFRTPSMVRQIASLSNEMIKFGERRSLTVDLKAEENLAGNGDQSHGEFIHLVRHLTCELHSKNFQEYFYEQGYIQYSQANALVRPVTSISQCAELCLKQTVNFMREMSRLEQIHSSHMDYRHDALQGKKACTEIHYIGKQNLESTVQDALDKQLTERMSVNGICVVGTEQMSESVKNEVHIKYEVLRELVFSTYRLDPTILYMKYPGITLADSNMDYSKRAATIARIKAALVKGEPVDEISDNFGSLEVCDNENCVRRCAKKCFLSRMAENTLKCRSFDYIEIDHPDKKTRRFCATNSITLKSTTEAGKRHLVDHQPKLHKGIFLDNLDTVKVWHYEPREGFVAESQKFSFYLEDDQSFSTVVHIGGFGLSFMVMTLFAIGSVAGLVVGSKLFARTKIEEVEVLVENRGYGIDSAGLGMEDIVDRG